MTETVSNSFSTVDRALALLATIDAVAEPPVSQTASDPALVENESTEERREHPRRMGSSKVSMSFGLLDVSEPAWSFRSTPHRGELLDLSMRGAAFESQLPAPAESVVALRLSDGTFDKGSVVRATIVRCNQLDDRYRIVCRFEKSLSLDELYQFGCHSFSHDIV